MGGKIFIILGIFVFFLFLSTSVNALVAYTDKITYTTGEQITVNGLIDSTNSSIEVTGTFYNSSDDAINSSTTNSIGSSTNTFSITNTIDGNYTPGNYYVNVSAGSESVKVNFEVVSEKFLLIANLIDNANVTPVNTSRLVTGDNNYSGDFGELRNLSLNTNKVLHYGNETLGSTEYHFVLVDQNYESVYDTLYIDDDKVFQLYNDSEDTGSYIETEKVKKAKEKFKDYVVGEIEFVTGNKVLFGTPVNNSVYDPNETVNFVVLVKNSSQYLKPGIDINVTLVDKSWNLINSTFTTTNDYGYFVASFNAPETNGFYTIMLNNTPAEVFSVETFKLFGMVTDLAGNPTYSFAPNPMVRVSATLKNSAGDTIDGASVSANITYPNGSVTSVSLSGGNGTYYNDLNMLNAPTGNYKVKIAATYSGNAQEFTTGFVIEIISLGVIGINPQFMDQAEGSGAMVDAFAPNSNISLMVALSNVSAGGMAAMGSEGEGLIDIDDSSTGDDECSTRVTLASIKDDRDVDLDLSQLNVQIMNLTNFINNVMGGMPPGEGGPSEQMLRQCMIVIFGNINRTGIYRAEVKVTHPLGEKTSSTTFSIQRLYATANPVDFKGEDFWFYAPNSTIRIKLKVMDMVTRQELPAENITAVQIIEMFKEWPSYQDAFTGDYTRATANASAANGTIMFTSPNSDGFFSMKFKFRANIGGSVEEGTGNGFFMLKKYIISGEPAGCQKGQPCMKGKGQNITLTVMVIDVSKGSLLDLGQSSGLSCTGCDGLEVDVNELWNDQIMKRMTNGTDYLVTNKGAVNASAGTANLTIATMNMPSGWYHADLILRDPSNPNNTYMGWGWFEIRNFWVDAMPVTLKEDGNLSASWGKASYGVGQPAVFAIASWSPAQGGQEYLPISNISLESMSRVSKSGPPVPLQPDVDYSYTTSVKNITVEFGGPGGQTQEMWVINITGLSKTSDYQANIRATTSKGIDVGSAWFDVSRYRVNLVYRGMENWPPAFAPNENLTVNISAYEFDGSTPHNLSQTGTKLKSVWNQKTGSPIKINSSTTCTGNNCTLTMNLSQLGSGSGGYDVGVSINDTEGNSKEDGFYFEVKSMSVVTPNIRDLWVDQITDYADREVDLGQNSRDSCDNDKWLQNDELSEQFHDSNQVMVGDGNVNSDTCPESENTTFCIWGSGMNFTLPFNKTQNTTAVAQCIYPNGTWGYLGCAEGGNYTYIVSNSTHLWIKVNSSQENPADMTGVSPKTEGESFEASGITWFIRKVGKEWNCPDGNCGWYDNPQRYLITAENFFELQSYPNHFDCSNPFSERIYVGTTYPENFAAVYCILNTTVENVADWCNNTDPINPQNRSAFYWASGECPAGKGDTIYIVSNSTHLWINESLNNLDVTPAFENESVFTIGGRTWKVMSIGKNQQEQPMLNWFSVMENDLIRLCWGENCNSFLDFSVSNKYENNYGRLFCVRSSGEWNDRMSCDPQETQLYVVSNTTHLWINNASNMISVQPMAEGDNFTISGDNIHNWTVASIGSTQPNFRVRHRDGKICGYTWTNCGENGCQMIPIIATPPTNHSTFYFGYVSNLIQNLENNNDQWFIEQFGQPFNDTRDVYMYHNTSHVWINDTPVFNGEGTAIGGSINDPHNGQWSVKTISKNKVTLTGLNVLARSGAWINTSLSRSGYIRVRAMNEQELGGWDPVTQSQVGIDINGDGETNSTVYFAVSDNASSGVYDTFFFSTSNNFSAPISANAINRAARVFGIGVNLTLLSIFPDGKQVRVYGNRTGDWGDMGELKIGSIVKVPVLILSPSGSYETANVSIKNIRKEVGEAPPQFIQLQPPYPNASCTGLCEISLNLSAINPPQTQSGKYAFEITAVKNGQEERMEEWRWPFVTMRNFLLDASIGDGGYISGFRQLPLYRYDGENYGWWIPEVRERNITRGSTTTTFTGMFSETSGNQTCPNFVRPANANQTADYWTMSLFQPSDYWAFINTGNESKVWIKNGNCNFTGIVANSLGNQINLTINNHLYMFYVLDVNVTNGMQGIVIGLGGVNSTIIEPLKYDNNQAVWFIMALNLSGQIYDVLLANDTTIDYPMCSLQQISECAKKAWFDTDGNFSDQTAGYKIGQNFTSDLYLARIGAGGWEGVSIANFSQISSLGLAPPNLPGVDVRVKDNTMSWFNLVSESVVGLDLNKDGGKNKTFFIATFDENENGQQNLTDNIVDDDLNITEEWWSDQTDPQNPVYKDFYGDEGNTIKEYRRSLPRGAETGNAVFGEDQNIPWEQSPSWEITNYNGSDMLLRKGKWQFQSTENMTVIMRVYSFDQNPVNANVSVEKLISFTPFGSRFLNASAGDYSAFQTSTNQYGWAVLNLRNTTWQQGEYMVQLRVQSGANIERSYNWFRVSQGGP